VQTVPFADGTGTALGAAQATNVMAAAPLVSAASLGRALGLAAKNAVLLLDVPYGRHHRRGELPLDAPAVRPAHARTPAPASAAQPRPAGAARLFSRSRMRSPHGVYRCCR